VACAPLVMLLAAAACARPPEPWLCPETDAGGLVVTEIRGAQSDTDTYGQWIELFNGSGRTLELVGLRVVLIHPNGIDRQAFFVRDGGLELPDGERVVLGHQDPADLPTFVDYGFFVDLHKVTELDPDGASEDAAAEEVWAPADLYTAATMEIEACGALVDRVEYDALPTLGTLALDGALVPPNADANDDPAAWCNDMNPPPDGPMTEIGTPGTPGEANPPCP
jgi:hypothetical protein